ncbi:hypothetical protein P171DRAFT_457486 [Karstenula rhodostoma CBS 690.94]|uniref:N(6)-L-threonylcarbamoyladenine synthase n=1 Tax=Karstenula rhodostoma CBS 690.94 TaxID=1392251 RepID=A0A9P4U943_9PLEO|nr:hypothetical protein P171DRAFT_457486 [Karstenula rhodostoma CBS 690.94]
MRLSANHGAFRPIPAILTRHLVTLAIETSCDDTAVAVLETKTLQNPATTVAKLHFHEKVTSNNAAFNGVHPLAALESHQENLANLVTQAIERLPEKKRRPDFISVTRGPGMRSNLFTGLDTAKGLAAAWKASRIPLVGVHHMQAHALTSRLVAALDASETFPHAWQDGPPTTEGEIDVAPKFPFLSVLASGGHTLLIHSATLTNHEVLGSTTDVAVGECLDKIARIVLPPELLQEAGNTMYGALLERFAFPPGKAVQVASSEPRSASEFCQDFASRYEYCVPKNHEEELHRNVSRWGWAFNQPLAKAGGGSKNKSLEMSFSGLMTAVERAVRYEHDQSTGKLTKVERSAHDISREERRDMAEFSMRAAFEHIAARVVLALQSTPANSIVVAGGVGANYYLRYVLACKLVAHGYGDVLVVIPPPHLCSDNAAMIAWTGTEMFHAGHQDKLSIRAIRKWPLDLLLSPPVERTT